VDPPPGNKAPPNHKSADRTRPDFGLRVAGIGTARQPSHPRTSGPRTSGSRTHLRASRLRWASLRTLAPPHPRTLAPFAHPHSRAWAPSHCGSLHLRGHAPSHAAPCLNLV